MFAAMNYCSTKPFFLFLIVAFVGVLFSAPANAQNEQWDTYMSSFGNKPASILVDMGLNANVPDKRYPFLVITGPYARNADKNGLPEREEIKDLEDILGATGDFLTGLTAKVLAGTVTYNRQRLNYYYVKDTTGVRNAVMRMYHRSFPGYKFALSMKHDVAWLTYSTFLYPSEETQNWMENNRVITGLLQSGDSLKKPRNILYAGCFKDDSARSAFASFITDKGYAIQRSPMVKTGTYTHCIVFSQFGYVKKDSVDFATTVVREAVKKFNGSYDGWSAPLK